MDRTVSPLLASYNKFCFLDGPTMIQPLRRLNKTLNGVEVYVKRDDVMGMGLAGNKLRKLEYLVGDAIKQGADMLITSGGLQSNHARLTAVAASYAGLDYELVLAQVVARDDMAYVWNGNRLLEEILDAKIHYLQKGENAQIFIDKRLEELRSAGRRPYQVLFGGSSPVGCLGYADCFFEIMQQSGQQGLHFDHIIVPNGSGGTQAGLLAGLTASGIKDVQIRSYTVLAELEDAKRITHEKAMATLKLLDSALCINIESLAIDANFLGDGYGLPTKEMTEAVKLLARTEGIFLDPVYSGKAFAGMLADIEAGRFVKGDRILFILTGGIPGLFAYRPAFGPH